MASSASRRVRASSVSSSPFRFCAPGPAGDRDSTCGSRSRLPPAPPPTSAGGVYLCHCFWFFLFHFSFCQSWDSPIGRRRGKSQLTRTLAAIEAPSPVLGTWRWLQGDHPASRSPGRYELSFSALGMEMVLLENAVELSPKAYAPGPSQLWLNSHFSSTSRSRPPSPLDGDFSFRLHNV